MTEHTPGPWKQVGSNVIRDNYPDAIAEAHLIGDSQETAWAQAEANARLIAAAPALLEACEAALQQWYADNSRGPGTEEDGRVARLLNEALAAARPEETR